MKLSRHSKLRMNERTTIPKNKRRVFFRNALEHGESWSDLEDVAIRNYMLEKESSHCKVKIYKGYIFIYGKNSKTLYTLYKLPKSLIKEDY